MRLVVKALLATGASALARSSFDGASAVAENGMMAKDSSEAWLRALKMTAMIGKNPAVTLPVVIDDLANRFESSPALLSDAYQFSYGELAERSRRYARWARAQGIGPRDVVCLLMANCPDYFAIWLGISRVGAIVSLINTTLQGAALRHCIALVSPKHVIAGAAFGESLAAVRTELDGGITYWTQGDDVPCARRIELECESAVDNGVDAEQPAWPSLRDPALYIYTSGTTGLPKAAVVSHFRIMQWSYWFAGLMDTGSRDRMYNCLPMYHSVGGVVAVGATLVAGGSVVLRERFSASEFWPDIAKWECTLFQYIGELCRYLLNSPVLAHETGHRIRLCCGNGLSGNIWQPFQERFRIPRILEFYASTEGNVSLYNCEGKPGALGRFPRFLAHRFPVELVKCDIETGVPARGRDGFCQRCARDETGHAIGRMVDDGPGRFEGYTDRSASEQKILRDVFAKGDAWYCTGDLMRCDAGGYFYFVDRIGDTFRWKGENVSTTEVEDALSGCPGVLESVVYGVAVPHADGRAGMAAIVTGEAFDLAQLHRTLGERLPAHARPRFLRIRNEIERTGTFKPQKHRLKQQGFDPVAISDALYFDDHDRKAFVLLDAPLYERMQSGDIRF